MGTFTAQASGALWTVACWSPFPSLSLGVYGRVSPFRLFFLSLFPLPSFLSPFCLASQVLMFLIVAAVVFILVYKALGYDTDDKFLGPPPA